MILKQSLRALKYCCILFILIQISACHIFEPDKTSINCIEKNFNQEVLHIGVIDGFNSRILALDPQDLSVIDSISVTQGAPFQIHYSNNVFYYTIDIDAEKSAFIKRDVSSSAILDSIDVPKGGVLFRSNDSTYISYAAYPNPYFLKNGEIVYTNDNNVVHTIQKIDNSIYAIIRQQDKLLFGSFDDTTFIETTNLTDIIRQILPDYSYVYGMHYLNTQNRLLLSIEDNDRPPRTLFFNINLQNLSYNYSETSQHANFIPTISNEQIFLTHNTSLRLITEPAKHLLYYDVKRKSINRLINFKKILGEEVYIQDLASDGCSLFLGVNRVNAPNSVIKFDLRSNKIDQIKYLGNEATSITNVSISSNPKQKGELK